jgi:hypothetical protein
MARISLQRLDTSSGSPTDEQRCSAASHARSASPPRSSITPIRKAFASCGRIFDVILLQRTHTSIERVCRRSAFATFRFVLTFGVDISSCENRLYHGNTEGAGPVCCLWLCWLPSALPARVSRSCIVGQNDCGRGPEHRRARADAPAGQGSLHSPGLCSVGVRALSIRRVIGWLHVF